MNFERTFLGAAVLLAMGGCTTWDPQTGKFEETTFGEAKNMTMAAQVIEPDPVYEYLDPPTSGEHAAQAVTRYRTDRVKKPERVRSTQSTSN